MKKELVEVPFTTLDFYKYEKDGLIYYEFDARECEPPEPMMNAINGLKILQNNKYRLTGIFFHEPFPLFQKIPSSIEYISEECDNDDFSVTFFKK